MAATAPATAWEKNLGDPTYNEKAESVWQTSDNGFVTVGETQNGKDGLYVIYLSKTDWQGNPVWTHTYDNANFARSVKQTSDGGYIVAGDHAGGPYLLKTSDTGSELWSQTYPRQGNGGAGNEIHSVDWLPNGDYIIAGSIEQKSDDGDWVMYLARIDGTGTMKWQKTYGGSTFGKSGSSAMCYSVWPTSDDGFILGGWGPDSKAMLVKVGADGTLQWYKVYKEIDGGSDVQYINVQQTRDGGYIWAGQNGGSRMLIKADPSGNLQWHQVYGQPWGGIYSVQQTWDDGYVFVGGSNPGFMNVTLVTRTDSQGKTLWEKDLSGTGLSFSSSVQQIGNGSYVLAGLTAVRGEDQDIFLAQLDKDFTPVPNAKLVSDSIPYIMEAGKAYTVQVTYENTGTMPWTYQDHTTFGHHMDAAKFGVTGENQTIQIGKIVRPGQSETFTFTMTAPAENGTYNPRFQMMQEGHAPYGALDNKTIWVVNGTGPAVHPPSSAPASVVDVPEATSKPTAQPTATQSQATTAPTDAGTPTKKSGGLPCLSSLMLPLLAIGIVTVSLYRHRKRGN